MNYFSVFSILYMTGVLYDMTEKWKSPGFATIIVVLISTVIFTKITRLKFFLFLVASSTYVLIFRYPELSNHLNLILLINFSLIIGIIYSWRNANTTDEHYYFRYDGVTHSSKDIVNDPNWITPKRNWEMYLMDFRVIQPEGLNQCRW